MRFHMTIVNDHGHITRDKTPDNGALLTGNATVPRL
jgi:hypothetical protein